MAAQDGNELEPELAPNSHLRRLENLQQDLPHFLYRAHPSQQLLRRYIRLDTLADIRKIFDAFKEDPQLLDVRLTTILPALTEAFASAIKQSFTAPRKSELALPIFNAVGTLLYDLCRIRGYKIVNRFWPNEQTLLLPLLHGLEYDLSTIAVPKNDYHTWEARYSACLCLSHILLTPFPLDSISDDVFVNTEPLPTPKALGVLLPPEVPSLPRRIFVLACVAMASPGKDGDAGIEVLQRLLTRPDIQELGLSATFLCFVRDHSHRGASSAASSLKATHTVIFARHLRCLSRVVQNTPLEKVGDMLQPIYTLVRPFLTDLLAQGDRNILKAATKLLLSLARASLAMRAPVSGFFDIHGDETVECLLSLLAVRDTGVRWTASKAITDLVSSLSAPMADAVIQAICGLLQGSAKIDFSIAQDVPYELASCWHGAIVSLAHLLHKNSIPAQMIREIMLVMLRTLEFEQRSTTAKTLGSQVRDSVCFALWSLIRHYATSELLGSHMESADNPITLLSIGLVNTALLDPARNIRRGAAAALQELIGRHPGYVVHGIELTTIIDYQATALYSRSLMSIVPLTAKLSPIYWRGLVTSLLTWRGLANHDESIRCAAADAIGALMDSPQQLSWLLDKLCLDYQSCKLSETEKRQGILLSLAALVKRSSCFHDLQVDYIWDLLILADSRLFTSHILRPELTVRAFSQLAIALLTRASILNNAAKPEQKAAVIQLLSYCLGSTGSRISTVRDDLAYLIVAQMELKRQEAQVMAWQLKLVDSSINSKSNRFEFQNMASMLASGIRCLPRNHSLRQSCLQTILKICQPPRDIDTRISVSGAITKYLLAVHLSDAGILSFIVQNLQDRTIDQRGDIGSLLRLQGIEACALALEQIPASLFLGRMGYCFALIAGLSLDKLDKIRCSASSCLVSIKHELGDRWGSSFFRDQNDTSSVQFFHDVLQTLRFPSLRLHVLQSWAATVSSATGPVLLASRVAAAFFFEKLSAFEPEKRLSIILSQFLTLPDNHKLFADALHAVSFAIRCRFIMRSELSDLSRVFSCLGNRSHLRNTSKQIAWLELCTTIDLICPYKTVNQTSRALEVIPQLSPVARRSGIDNVFTLQVCGIWHKRYFPLSDESYTKCG